MLVRDGSFVGTLGKPVSGGTRLLKRDYDLASWGPGVVMVLRALNRIAVRT